MKREVETRALSALDEHKGALANWTVLFSKRHQVGFFPRSIKMTGLRRERFELRSSCVDKIKFLTQGQRRK